MVRSTHFRWLREHPRAADGLLAACIGVVGVVFHLSFRDADVADPSLAGVLLTLGATLPVAWRRRAPVPVLLITTVCQMAMEMMDAAGPGWAGVLIAAYTLGAYRSGAFVWRIGSMLLVVVTAFVVVGVVQGVAPWQALISTPVVFAGAILIGDNARRRRERSSELAERAERVERERLMTAQRHVQEERNRIARELHDVVAHSVSLMVIQTAAARRQMLADPATADSVLAAVEDTGRVAMQEMRRLLGVLRDDASHAQLVPQPSLAGVQDLAQAASDLPVRVLTEGDLQRVPPGVELSVYRIVQEALTNVRRHAGTVHHVEVSLTRLPWSLVVEVADDGRGAAASREHAVDGFGLLGMRERVAAYDGDLVVGPRGGGGWRVRATFPLEPV